MLRRWPSKPTRSPPRTGSMSLSVYSAVLAEVSTRRIATPSPRPGYGNVTWRFPRRRPELPQGQMALAAIYVAVVHPLWEFLTSNGGKA